MADVDIRGNLGHGFRMVGAYGYALPRRDNYTTSSGVSESVSGPILWPTQDRLASPVRADSQR